MQFETRDFVHILESFARIRQSARQSAVMYVATEIEYPERCSFFQLQNKMLSNQSNRLILCGEIVCEEIVRFDFVPFSANDMGDVLLTSSKIGSSGYRSISSLKSNTYKSNRPTHNNQIAECSSGYRAKESLFK